MSKSRMAALLLLAALACACTSWHKAATDVNVSGEDIVYIRDERTDLCFAVLFVRNKVGTSVSNMGMTGVPCDALGGAPAR